MLELQSAPLPVLAPFLDIINQIRARAVGEPTSSPYFAAATWAVVCLCQMEGFVRAAISSLQLDDNLNVHYESRDSKPGDSKPGDSKLRSTSTGSLSSLQKKLAVLRQVLAGATDSYFVLISEALVAAERVGDVALAAALHGYLVLLIAHTDDCDMHSRTGESPSPSTPLTPCSPSLTPCSSHSHRAHLHSHRTHPTHTVLIPLTP